MIINVDGSKLVNLTKNYGDEATAGTPRWSPDSSKLAINCHCPDGEGIYIINRDGTGLKKLIGGMTQYPDWSPDGKKIAYMDEYSGNHDIFIVGVDGNNPVNLTQPTG